mgnify:FL=1
MNLLNHTNTIGVFTLNPVLLDSATVLTLQEGSLRSLIASLACKANATSIMSARILRYFGLLLLILWALVADCQDLTPVPICPSRTITADDYGVVSFTQDMADMMNCTLTLTGFINGSYAHVPGAHRNYSGCANRSLVQLNQEIVCIMELPSYRHIYLPEGSLKVTAVSLSSQPNPVFDGFEYIRRDRKSVV